MGNPRTGELGSGELYSRRETWKHADFHMYVTPTASGAFVFTGQIMALATPGASVNIGGGGTLIQGTGANAKIGIATAQPTYATAATNGSLTFQFSVQYSASNGTNAATIFNYNIERPGITAS